jgi:AcrR family transcriptional regulator
MGKGTREQDAKSAAASRTKQRSAAKPSRALKVDPATRRQAILDAALTVFAERGFETARLDDVAARAGVAKGTLYLYFKDKESLFEEVVRSAVSPILERLNGLAATPDVPFDTALEAMFAMFEKEVLGTQRKLLIRLIIAEGPRFPRIAEFYYRNVVGRIMPLVAKLAERAAKRGEIASDAVARYPQLVAAPLLMTVIWDGLFAKIDPLDVAGLLRTHRELLTGKARRASP